MSQTAPALAPSVLDAGVESEEGAGVPTTGNLQQKKTEEELSEALIRQELHAAQNAVLAWRAKAAAMEEFGVQTAKEVQMLREERPKIQKERASLIAELKHQKLNLNCVSARLQKARGQHAQGLRVAAQLRNELNEAHQTVHTLGQDKTQLQGEVKRLQNKLMQLHTMACATPQQKRASREAPMPLGRPPTTATSTLEALGVEKVIQPVTSQTFAPHAAATPALAVGRAAPPPAGSTRAAGRGAGPPAGLMPTSWTTTAPSVPAGMTTANHHHAFGSPWMMLPTDAAGAISRPGGYGSAPGFSGEQQQRLSTGRRQKPPTSKAGVQEVVPEMLLGA